MKLTLYDFLRIGHVTRWHNVLTVRQQTVAEHSFLVTIIAMDLFDQLVGIEDAPVNAMSLVVGAMFHDAPEIAGGDIPTPSKKLIRELTGDPAIFDKLDEMLMPELPYIKKKLDPHLEFYIKMADTIEGYMWIFNNGAGTHADMVKMNARKRLEDLVAKYEEREPDGGWYEAVNRVLMAMGVPYVHKESRISPP